MPADEKKGRVERPTMNLRFRSEMVAVPGPHKAPPGSGVTVGRVQRILQQEWEVLTVSPHDSSLVRETEWRDVPLVDG